MRYQSADKIIDNLVEGTVFAGAEVFACAEVLQVGETGSYQIDLS
jgi:hypothetical protein